MLRNRLVLPHRRDSRMTPQLLALLIAAAVMACGILGLTLQGRLHEFVHDG